MTARASEQRFFAAGTVLGDRFEVVRRLGAGSFGAVYEARQLVFGQSMRRVALKLFHADKVNRDNIREVFSDAVELIGLLEYEPSLEILKGIVQVYDIGIVDTTQGPQPYLCMKLIAGGKTLDQPIRRFRHAGGMPVALSLRYLRQLLVPLAWMHTVGERVHGDLKPDNVLLSDRDEVVLTDFGLAAHLVFGAFGGAIQYQAPEALVSLPGQALGRAKAAADVYGVGLIWYQMLTGRHSFEQAGLEAVAAGEDQGKFILAHHEARKWPFRPAGQGEAGDGSGRIVPPSEINDEMHDHPQLEVLLQSCLAYRQSERPGNARMLLRKIDQYLSTGKIDGLSVPGEPESESEDPSLPKKTPDALLHDADAFVADGRVDKALEVVDSLLGKTSPGEVRLQMKVLLAKARALAVGRRAHEALEICSQAQGLAPQDPLVHETKARVYDCMPNKSIMAARARAKAEDLRRPKGRR